MRSATDGIGTIYVAKKIYNELGRPYTAREWHKALLLPYAYCVEGVYKSMRNDIMGSTYEVTVSGPDIPACNVHPTQVEVEPIYCREADGSATLTKIHVKQWEEGRWKTLKTQELGERFTWTSQG